MESKTIRKLIRQLESGRYRSPLESAGQNRIPSREELEQRFEQMLSSSQAPDPDDWRSRLRADVRAVLDALFDGSPLPPETSVGLEAVVIADGSRPVFNFSNGKIGSHKGGPGPFVDAVRQNASMLERAAASIGRIETDAKLPPPGADKWHEGTAFMVSGNLAMTNRHVIERMVNEPTRASAPFTLKTPYWLNFDAQHGSAGTRRFEILQVVHAGPAFIGRGGNHQLLDMALLRIGASESGSLSPPPALTLSGSLPPVFSPISVIGFPAAPKIHTGTGNPPPDYEIESVLRFLFGSTFGYKRCASGEIDALPGSLTDDTQPWVVQHDACTLGGNSGSPMLLLGQNEPRVLALHYAGTPRTANFAHAFDKMSQQLSTYGIALSA